MALLAVDIGNTTTSLGIFAEALPDAVGSIEKRFDIPTRTLTHRPLTRETLDVPLAGILPPETIALASVVPWATDEIIVVLHEMFAHATIIVLTSSNIPLRIGYPRPDELGTDRLLGALAAYQLWGKREHRPAIVVDMGTATTYDCIGADGLYLGGAISPGLELGAEALAQRAAQLPAIELSFPASIIGRTTIESVQSGILYGGLAQFEGLVKRLAMAAFPKEEPIVCATGGLSRLFEGRTEMVTHFAPDLVLDGIRLAAGLSRERNLAPQITQEEPELVK